LLDSLLQEISTMKTRAATAIILVLGSSASADKTSHQGKKVAASVREGRSQRTNLFGHNDNDNNGGGAVVATGYGPPSGGSSGYGAPSGGYGAPCDSYGCGGGGGGGGAPVYVYQQGQGNNGQGSGGGGGLGALAALLPLGGLALLLPLGLLALGTIFPTTTIVGRKKRDTDYSNSTMADQQANLLQAYMDNFGLGQESDLQKDMVAKYLQCTDTDPTEPSFPGCLEKLSCIFNDRSITITHTEKEVATAVLQSILNNQFVTPAFKRRIQQAGQTGYSYPGSCDKYRCHHHLLPQETKKPSKKSYKSKKKLWKKPYF